MKRLLKIDEAAEYVGLHPQSIRTLISEEKFPFKNLSRGDRPCFRFDIRELDKWIDEQPGSQVNTEA